MNFWIILRIFWTKIFFIGLLVFSLLNSFKIANFVLFFIFEKKIQKIVKILKFQMNLKHPIFNIFWQLTRRWTFERPYFTNSEKNNFFQTVAKNIFEKNNSNFCCVVHISCTHVNKGFFPRTFLFFGLSFDCMLMILFLLFC